jgi:Cdc6-like AAA superfamily ATPase
VNRILPCVAEDSGKTHIILNEQALLARFPQDSGLVHNAEGERILAAIKGLSEGKAAENILIYGPAGAGKTTLVRWALKQVEKQSRRPVCIYANCWRYGTSMALYSKIADALGEPVSRRGRASDEIFDRIVELMRASKRPVLLVLDEIEALLNHDDAQILHNIAATDEERVLFGIMAVSDDENVLSKLPDKTRDILGFNKIPVPSYTRDELAALLKNRAAVALRSGTWNDAIIEAIAEIGVMANGSAHFALKTLWSAAKHCEGQGLDCITIEELERIKTGLGLEGIGLSSEEIAIIELLEDGPVSSTRLYPLFCRKMPKSKRQIRNYLHGLEEKGIIGTRYVQGKYNYGSTIIQLTEGVEG